MAKWLERSELLIGTEGREKLEKAHVLIVGLGGIGSFAGEFIARAGVGKITLIDGDCFDETNKNRQLTALDSTIGKNKAVVLAERIREINPTVELNVIQEFVEPNRVWEILKEQKPDYVMDCIDSVSPKIEWIVACIRFKIKLVSHMGAGGKMDPSKMQVTSLEKAYNCKLALQIKKRLKKKDITFKKVRAVFSSEIQDKSSLKLTDGTNYKKSFYGTISYMPALFGLMGAAEVIQYILKKD
ncbi:MAG: ThiF family adenylyltransferase [Flavobacteriia bacterium]|jgi:tRNA A37 threonylcarbamoyladenosine dehydratase